MLLYLPEGLTKCADRIQGNLEKIKGLEAKAKKLTADDLAEVAKMCRAVKTYKWSEKKS